MSRRIFTSALLVLLATIGGTIGLQAQTVTWTGRGNDDYNDNPANWLGNTLPLNNGTEEFIFGPVSQTFVTFEVNVNARKVSVIGNTKSYYLDDDYGSLTIGSDGLVYAPATPITSYVGAYPVIVPVDQTWNIQSGRLEVQYNFQGAGQITKTGAGALKLKDDSSSSWTGGLVLTQGNVIIGPNGTNTTYALGTGNLTFNGGTLETTSDSYYGSTVFLGNNVVVNAGKSLTTVNEVETHIGYYNNSEDFSTIELNGNTTVNSSGKLLFFEGNIIEATVGSKLTVNGSGAVVLLGDNSYTGGTEVTNGVLVFGRAYSIPSNNLDSSSVGHLKAGPNGYIGFGDDMYTNSTQSYFISDFDKANTTGTIGFDTDPSNSVPNTFTDPIDLTGFGTAARLGSATRAILSSTAVITPQGSAYRFGGGGGWLQVDSPLTGARSLVLDSPAARPLTLRVTNDGNNYTGGTSVTNSALIFGNNIFGNPSFPTGTGNVTINTGGYVGFEFWTDMGDTTYVASSLAKINPASVGAVGFDNYSLLYVPIDLSAFTGALYLGTATWGNMGPGLTLAGTNPITTTNGGADPYRFAGYKGGDLQIDRPLTGSAGVKIGDPTSPGTFGDYFKEKYSTVELTGNNAGLTGNVTLYGGQLMVGQSNGTPGTDPTNALGTGTLVVTGMTLPPEWQDEDGELPHPQLDSTVYVEGGGLIIPNNVSLGTTLNLGDNNHFVLKGRITGTGGLYLNEDAWIGIGDPATDATTPNTFSGGIYLSGYSTLDVLSDHATGTGPLSFGYGSSSEIYFSSAAPVVHGLASKEDTDYSYLYAELTNTVLTIDQSFNSKFNGQFRSDAVYTDDNFRIVKAGAGTLRIDDGGLYFYRGTTEATLPGTPEVSLQINGGTLVLGEDFYIESNTPTIWVHGGTLALDSPYYNFGNPVVIDNGGRLTGTGQLGTAAIGAGATLSPGLADAGNIGKLTFNTHLTLAGGGSYEWNLANFNGFVSDNVDVPVMSPLEITATPADKFTLKAITLGANGNPGILTGMAPNTSYSWMLMSMLTITGFDANAFTLDVSQFQTDIGTGLALGTFSISKANEDTWLMLNLTTFAGIPEPSTYALLALGLGFLGLTAWRKRRAS